MSIQVLKVFKFSQFYTWITLVYHADENRIQDLISLCGDIFEANLRLNRTAWFVPFYPNEQYSTTTVSRSGLQGERSFAHFVLHLATFWSEMLDNLALSYFWDTWQPISGHVHLINQFGIQWLISFNQKWWLRSSNLAFLSAFLEVSIIILKLKWIAPNSHGPDHFC